TGIEPYRHMSDEFERICTEMGRDPSSVRRSWIGGGGCAPTPAGAGALTDGRWDGDDPDDVGVAGRPHEGGEQMDPLIGLGMDYFMLDCGGFPRLTTLELLIQEVLPALNA